MMPAWTGPTGTWNTPSPSTSRNLCRTPVNGGSFGAQVEVLAQRINFRPVVVQHAAARVGMAEQPDAEQILDFALLPVDGGTALVSEVNSGLSAGTGTRRIRSRARNRARRRNRRKRPSVAGVFGEHAGQPRVPLPVELGTKAGDQLHRGLE